MNAIKPEVIFVSNNDYAEMLKKIEAIGRVCYKSEDRIKEDSPEKFIKGILAHGHESVIEHESITVRLICDRGVSHEIVRHRIASYSQESTRYCNYANDRFGSQITCIDISTGFGYDLNNASDLKKYQIWNDAMCAAEKFYFEMLRAGARPEEARSVLPNALKTEIVMTMNLREWRHFLKLRCDKHAHPQMIEISQMILKEFATKYPAFFADLLNP